MQWPILTLMEIPLTATRRTRSTSPHRSRQGMEYHPQALWPVSALVRENLGPGNFELLEQAKRQDFQAKVHKYSASYVLLKSSSVKPGN